MSEVKNFYDTLDELGYEDDSVLQSFLQEIDEHKEKRVILKEEKILLLEERIKLLEARIRFLEGGPWRDDE
jgi:regulator of sigma D